MASAFRCDRCGHLWEGEPKTLSGNAIHLALKDRWFPYRVDLCINCQNELHHVLRDWWLSIKWDENEKVP